MLMSPSRRMALKMCCPEPCVAWRSLPEGTKILRYWYMFVVVQLVAETSRCGVERLAVERTGPRILQSQLRRKRKSSRPFPRINISDRKCLKTVNHTERRCYLGVVRESWWRSGVK